MFEGDEELNFTPEEAELVARAEGRTPRRRQRTPAVRPNHGGGGGVLFGIILAALFLIGLTESFKVSSANPERAAASRPSDQPLRQSQQPQITQTTRASAQETLPARPTQDTSTQAVGQVAPTQDLLPPGWERTSLAQQIPLLANPWQGAVVVGLIPPRTEFLVHIAPTDAPCSDQVPRAGRFLWHATVLASGTGWGYICVAFPESADERIRRPLPAGWIRRVYQGDGAAPLQFPHGQILPGTEVLMHPTGKPNEFFLMSTDGLSWGFGYSTNAYQANGSSEPSQSEPVAAHTTQLPPGWERVVLSSDTPLYEAPGSNSRVVGTLPAGTAIFVRNHWECWHGAVTESGEAWGSICVRISPHDPVRMAFGDWTYERMPSGRCALIRRLSGDIVLYIFADGNGWGRTSKTLL